MNRVDIELQNPLHDLVYFNIYPLAVRTKV